MLWKFSFASGTTLDRLWSRETPPSVEELLDEPDILAECKAQNSKLVTYLSREDSVKSLLKWVVSGLDDLDAQAESAANEAFHKAVRSDDIFPPFTSEGPLLPAGKPEPAPDEENSPLAPGLGIGLGQGLAGREETEESDNRARYPQIASEILTSELWTIPETIMSHKETILKPFWDAVVPPLDKAGSASVKQRRECERAHQLFWDEDDEERERKREVIRGMWMRVNASLLLKRTTEMFRFIQSQPDIVERLIARIESPAVQDMLARIIQTEEAGVSDVMSWLGEQRLIPRLLELLSPQHPPSTHHIVGDLLKGIISVSAPNSSFNPQGGNAMDQQGGLQSSTARDNRLVRELTNQESIATLVRYITEEVQLTDREWKGLNGDGPGTHKSDPFVVHPLPSVASATSSLCSVCNVIVEVIRRNNSDLAEPYLFNTLRNRLMSIQGESLQGKQDVAPDEKPEDEDETRQKLEAALPELVDKLAIVHLGNLVAALTDKFGSLHKLLVEPRSVDRAVSALNSNPLTMERFRVIELYAELLHSSNMATLNRAPGTGPNYSPDGALTGGLDGLDKLGLALQSGESGEDTAEAEETGDNQITPAKELPISSSSTDYSLTESDDVALSDDEEPVTPTSHSGPTMDVTVPPPPSKASAERLRNVMGIDPDKVDASETASAVAVAATTVAPSVSSETQAPHPPADDPLSTGERLKQQFIRYRILPTLLDLFFEHAQNNFLHHLVYDILQQILNGPLGRGYNRELVIDLFQRAKLIDRILVAQRMNDEVVASKPPKPRLSYMGHISLIAEELVKFFARCPADLYDVIRGSFEPVSWEAFVDGSLRETRARDSAPLAGGKPSTGLGSGMSTQSERSDSESDDDDDAGGSATIGEPLSRSVPHGSQTDSFHDTGADDERSMEQFWSRRRNTADSSDDDDDDADWLRPSNQSNEDDFGAFQSTGNGDDDAWGTFTSVNADASENPFGDDAFAPAQSSEPLTPRDWAEAFDREFESTSTPPAWAEDADEVPSIVVPEDSDSATPSSWSFPGDESEGEDLPVAPSETHRSSSAAELERLRAQSERNEAAAESHLAALSLHESVEDDERRASEEAEAGTATPDEPLGPGTAPGTHLTAGGMVERVMPDGRKVVVPEDDIARGIDEAMEGRLAEH